MSTPRHRQSAITAVNSAATTALVTAAAIAALASPADAKAYAPNPTVQGPTLQEAQKDVTKGGLEVKGIWGVGGGGALGAMAGGRLVDFLTDELYVGGAGFAGPFLASSGGLGYGGFVVGAEYKLSQLPLAGSTPTEAQPNGSKLISLLALDGSVLVGAGGGVLPSGAGGGGMVFEPELAISYPLGVGKRLTGCLSYLFSPSQVTSGLTLGVRLDLKSWTPYFPME